jgi:hypothetical protein
MSLHPATPTGAVELDVSATTCGAGAAVTLVDGVDEATFWATIASILGAGAGASSVSSFACTASKIASEEFLLL